MGTGAAPAGTDCESDTNRAEGADGLTRNWGLRQHVSAKLVQPPAASPSHRPRTWYLYQGSSVTPRGGPPTAANRRTRYTLRNSRTKSSNDIQNSPSSSSAVAGS